jgi:hypothetical protein
MIVAVEEKEKTAFQQQKYLVSLGIALSYVFVVVLHNILLIIRILLERERTEIDRKSDENGCCTTHVVVVVVVVQRFSLFVNNILNIKTFETTSLFEIVIRTCLLR